MQQPQDPNVPFWMVSPSDAKIEDNPNAELDQHILNTQALLHERNPKPNISEQEFRMRRKCLIGVIQDARYFSSNQLYAVLEQLWNIERGRFIINWKYQNNLLIRFADQKERDAVLEGSPWNVEGGFLMLAPWRDETLNMPPFKILLSPVWVQIHGLPNDLLSPETVIKVGTVAGNVIDCQESSSYKRLKTIIKPHEPLVAGVFLLGQDGNKKHWVEFRYERVFTLCYRCGVIGHVKRYCSITEGEMNLRAREIQAKVSQARSNVMDFTLLVKFHGTYDLYKDTVGTVAAAQQGHTALASQQGQTSALAAQRGQTSAASQQGQTAGAAQQGQTAGATQQGQTAGAAQQGQTAGAAQQGQTAGAARQGQTRALNPNRLGYPGPSSSEPKMEWRPKQN